MFDTFMDSRQLAKLKTDIMVIIGADLYMYAQQL